MRKVVLSQSEKEKLTNLHKYSDNLVERNRSLCLLLSSQGNSMSKVAKMLGMCYQTISNLLDAWERADPKNRFSVLKYSKGQGAKVKLKPIEKQIPELMEKHNRNLKLVLQDIENEHNIRICKATLQNFLKGTGLCL
jgi:transposase